MNEAGEKPLAYSVPQAAALLGISRTHGYELVARDELAHVRLGRRVLIPRVALERLLDVAVQRPEAS
jgi:excisionase family DNA binding protein